MRFIEEVQIPLFVLPPPDSCRLICWRVPDGSYVTMGVVVFELEVNGQVYEVESFHTGFMKITGTAGDSYKVGDCIGHVVCDQVPDGAGIVNIELTLPELSRLDELRGSRTRRDYLRDLVVPALTSPANE